MARQNDNTAPPDNQPRQDVTPETDAEYIARLHDRRWTEPGPRGVYLKVDGKVRTFNLDPADYGFYAPGLDDQELLDTVVEFKNRTIENLLAKSPVNPENLTFEQLHLPVTDAPVERQPCILERDDGASILYSGRFSSVHGEPGCGKSWLALIAAGEAIKRGGRVIWVDSEDRPSTLAERARPLGLLEAVTDPELFRFVNSADLVEVEDVTEQALAWLLTAKKDPRHSMVVIDSAESWGCPADGSDVAPWLDKFIEPWRRADVAVLLLDHIPKRPQGRPPGAIGSQHKRARVDGAALRCVGKPWTKKAGGYISLVNEKDRVGDLPAGLGRAVATLRGSWDQNGAFEWSLTAPKSEAQDETEADHELTDAVLQAIRAAGPAGIHGKRELQRTVGRNQSEVLDVVNDLVEDGRIIKEQRGQGFTYRVEEGSDNAEQSEAQAPIDFDP